MDNKTVSRVKHAQALQHFLKGYLYIITAYYLTETLFLHPYSGLPFYFLMCILLGLQSGSVLLIHVVPVSYLKPIITAYFHFIAILLFYLSVELGYIYAIMPYVWFFIVMLGVYIIYPWRTAVYWFIYLFFLSFSARILSFVLIHNNISLAGRIFHPKIEQFATPEHNYIEISISLLFSFIVFCFFLYYLHRFQEIKIQSLLPDTTEKEPNESSFTENGKLKALYMQIEKHFESAQPFVNPDFTILQLASALNTNTTYVSRAIKQERDINFSVFINHYRIEKVKEMLHDKSNRYTLEYVAAACGFRHQSTFNKVFKLIEGVTPSSYCNKYRQETSSN